jgi:hypothetical protein
MTYLKTSEYSGLKNMAKKPQLKKTPDEGLDYVTKRPLYKKEYCKMLIAHMEEGYSFASFGAVAKVDSDTVNNWANTYPEFMAAKKVGLAALLKNHENIAKRAMNGEIDKFAQAVWIFTAKNRFPNEYKESTEVVHRTAIDKDMTPEQAAAAYDKLNQK